MLPATQSGVLPLLPVNSDVLLKLAVVNSHRTFTCCVILSCQTSSTKANIPALQIKANRYPAFWCSRHLARIVLNSTSAS